MADYDVLRDIVRNGSDLVLTKSIEYDVVRELAALAAKSGARLTLPADMDYDLVREISSKYGKGVTFVNSLRDFEKPSK